MIESRCAARLLSIVLAGPVLGSACTSDDGGTEPPTAGAIEVATSTTGSTFELDDYVVTMDGGTSQPVEINGTTTFTGVAAGDREVELTDVASNCTVAGANPRTVRVEAGGTASTRFDIECFAVLRDQIAFSSTRTGNGDIFVMGADGSNPTNLTNFPGGQNRQPSISPDGTRIAFNTSRDGDVEVYVINADGSNSVNLTNNEAFDRDPAWSPDGTRIAFSSGRDGGGIHVMAADGSGVMKLTNGTGGFEPAWSPDGTKIAFNSQDVEIYVMDADGSNPVNITNHEAFDASPVWSPDGTRIAFRTDRDGNNEIYVMDADGSNPVNLTNNEADDRDPAWSPDGMRIAFMTDRGGFFDIHVMDADGSNPVNLTNCATLDRQPDWSRP